MSVHFRPMTEHYSVGLEPDEADWWPARCDCGWTGGLYPSAEDAADALMDHAFTEGAREVMARLHAGTAGEE